MCQKMLAHPVLYIYLSTFFNDSHWLHVDFQRSRNGHQRPHNLNEKHKEIDVDFAKPIRLLSNQLGNKQIFVECSIRQGSNVGQKKKVEYRLDSYSQSKNELHQKPTKLRRASESGRIGPSNSVFNFPI